MRRIIVAACIALHSVSAVRANRKKQIAGSYNADTGLCRGCVQSIPSSVFDSDTLELRSAEMGEQDANKLEKKQRSTDYRNKESSPK